MHRDKTFKLVPALALLLTTSVMTPPAQADDSPTFRGPHRDGQFHEAGLAQKWPQNGPPQLWSVSGVGEGYSSVAIADGKIFTSGQVGEIGRLVAFDLKGKKLWERAYGKEHPGNGYPGSRSTPSTDGESVFVLSSEGIALAADAKTGDVRWKLDILKKFDGKNVYFGVSESPLIDGDRVIYTPGGKNASVVALNKKTGELVWRTDGLSDTSAYCSVRAVEIGGKRQLVTLLSEGAVGIDPDTGKVLWKEKIKAEYNIHAVSPLVDGDLVVVSHGYSEGTRAFKYADGKLANAWHQKKLDVHHGGSLLVDGVFYGAASKGAWYSLNTKDGEILSEVKRLGKGSLIYADGKIYGYNEAGEVLLVEPKDLSVVSKFEISAGEGQHWSHPVISDSVLYIRHGDVLMAFDISASSDS